MQPPTELLKFAGSGTLVRPRFKPGLLLEDDDLTAGVNYTRDMMRLMLRSLFGCGVVCGLDVKAKLICNGGKVQVMVSRGLALDGLGNPIEVPRDETVVFDPQCDKIPPQIYIAVCFIEKCCRPKDISCSPDDDGDRFHTRSREGFEIKLYDGPPECGCSCEPAPEAPRFPKGECCKEAEKQGAAAAKEHAKEHAQATPDKTSPVPSDKCKCYADHNKGVCACECSCNCVLIGKVDTLSRKDPDSLPVDMGMRRRIRPVLAGFLDCLEPKSPEKPVEPKTPAPAPPSQPRERKQPPEKIPNG